MSNPWEIQTIEYDKTNAEGNAEVSGYGQISILLNKYVLKEKGKGLSSNDFTDNDVQKLKSIEVGAETNKLETLTINGGVKIYPNDEKNINLPIPTKVSQLNNDLGYAKLINMSHDDDFSDSYVGKAKFAFQDEENIAIGKNSNVEHGGIAIGKNTATSETYDINIGNELLHNRISDIWEGKTSSSLSADVAMKNTNGTNLTQLDVVIEDLATETQNRIDADGVLQDNIDTETQNRIDADGVLQNNINAETQNRIDADNSLSNDIGTEASIRQNADDLLASDISNVSSRITSIEDKIPSQASSSNQLADKSFVNSSIQTNTANFRGNWNTWSDVPSDNVDLYPQDYAGSRIPTVNDYLVVENASDYTANTLSGTWRFKYGGVWETDGKNGWIPEYQVNEEPLTSEQVYAINSGITSDKVSSYDAHLIDTSNPHSVTKSQVGLGDVINSGDSAIPIEGGTTKFTTGGAYTELAKKNDKITITDNTSSGTFSDSTELVITPSALSNPKSFVKQSCLALFNYISSKLSGAISTILTSNLSTDLALVSNSDGKVSTSTVTSTQLGYLSNVTSDVQNQLSAKQTKTLVTPLTIEGVQQTTVEGALGGLNSLCGTKLTMVTSLPLTPSNQETVLYVGTSSGGLKSGGIYQYQVSEWVLISYAESFTFSNSDFSVDTTTDEVSLLPSRRVFNGSKADWDLLSVAEKTQYGATAFTDDEGGGMDSPVDVVESGNMHTVTSNAVAKFAFDKSKIRTGIVYGGSANNDDWFATFDTPFADSNYTVIVTPQSSTANCPNGWYTVLLSATGFRIYCSGNAPTYGFHYIAIHN